MIKKINPLFILGFILLLGIFLRVYNIPQTLLFHFDQGYHGLAIKDIWDNQRIALLGHKTDAEGVFHGSVFYYFMLPFYLISGWNPAGVSILLAVLDGFSVIFIYLAGKNLFNKNVGLLAALLYAVSYALISYSRWLSNVTPIPFFTSVMLYFLVKVSRGKTYFVSLSALTAGFIIQLNGAIGFFFTPLLAIIFFLNKSYFRSSKKYILYSIILFFLPSLPLLLFDLRHDFLVTKSILALFSHRGSGLSFNGLTQTAIRFQKELSALLTFGYSILASSLVGLSVLALLRTRQEKNKDFQKALLLALFWMVPVLGLFMYPGGIHQFFFIGALPGLILFVSWGINFWYKIPVFKMVIPLLIAAVVIINLSAWRGFLKPGFNLIPIGTRNLITLDDRLRAVDFMYQKSAGKIFRTSVYIIPYDQEQPWDYIFSWYGKSKYGYLPELNGKTFVIYEPDYDYPYRLDTWLAKVKEDHGDVLSSIQLHDLTVEERSK